MPALRYRARTQIAAAALAAMVMCGAVMGPRSYEHYRRAMEYGTQERWWRKIAASNNGWADFGAQCAKHYADLAQKYRQAMWRPWMPVIPDPAVPGHPGVVWPSAAR
jgi:hypothetical protein